LVIVVAAALASVAATPQEGQPAGATVTNSADCLACHETAFTSAFKQSKHAAVAESCGGCHAGAADHSKAMMEGNTDAPKPSLKGLKAKDLNPICLGCHEQANQAAWTGGAHERRGLTCTECHGVHDYKSAKGQLKTARDAETCYACHTNIRALSLRTSHHPIREGLLTCASCHNPHDGTRPKMISADWTNELCYKCHTEKRGPFLWEHLPVRENCLNCHNPHGSNHDKLLVAKQPYLCQRCHLNTRHPGTFYDGRVAGNPNPGVSPIGTASNRATEHACKNCHQYVHGGNAPSGPYLGR
jgi:DmsE family decaheme c-type cytochrome